MPEQKLYDIETITKILLDNQLANRPELVRQFRDAIMHMPVCKQLLANILSECLEKGKQPAELGMAGLIYGMVLGVNLEKYRAAQEDASRIITV